ncbi:DUF2628 domain-containing protein, partial [Rhizobium ruizarguesonis]
VAAPLKGSYERALGRGNTARPNSPHGHATSLGLFGFDGGR